MKMIHYKTLEEMESIRESGALLSKAHGEIAQFVTEGTKLTALDKIAEEFIRDHHAKPSFLGYDKYPASLCISVNDMIVHGIPNEYELQDGDIVSIDCGVLLNGFHSDSAYTYGIGELSEEKKQLLKVTKTSLYKGIEEYKKGKRLGDVGSVISNYAYSFGYGIVKELTGHGIGRNLHEQPCVSNYGTKGRGKQIKEGLVIALEPMITMGSNQIIYDKDGWGVRTQDKKPAAHYEHTIAICNGKTEVLTTFEYIEKNLNKKNNCYAQGV